MVKESVVISKEAINSAISYIFDHIEEDITVDDVANHCAYSKYHLTRMFKEETGEALYQFIKRVKLERSAFSLKTNKNVSVTEIGENYGYSASNFSTAFKKQLDKSPADFRKEAEDIAEKSVLAQGISIDEMEALEGNVSIDFLDSFLVVYERRIGNYHNLMHEWCEFQKKYEGLVSPDSLIVECTIDDPSITDENHCMYEMAFSIDPYNTDIVNNPKILTHWYEGGKYAIYHFKGYPKFLYMVYQEVFGRWLSKTGNRLDNRPIIDIYRLVREDMYMEIDICFPIV